MQIISTIRLDKQCLRNAADLASSLEASELPPTVSSTPGKDVPYFIPGPVWARTFALQMSITSGRLRFWIFFHLRSQHRCIQLGQISCMIALWCIRLVIVVQNLKAGVNFSRHIGQWGKWKKIWLTPVQLFGRIWKRGKRFKKRESN